MTILNCLWEYKFDLLIIDFRMVIIKHSNNCTFIITKSRLEIINQANNIKQKIQFVYLINDLRTALSPFRATHATAQPQIPTIMYLFITIHRLHNIRITKKASVT